MNGRYEQGRIVSMTILNVAIIGSGPSGFFAADGLLKQGAARVDMFDRLPTPYGLVRGGVAPDHQKIKNVVKVFEKCAQLPGFRFFGNVNFGSDLVLSELLSLYHAVIFAVGAKSDRKLGVPGEDLTGSDPATAFVGWYNDHPDYSHYHFDLPQSKVAVIGVGNVAIDVTRVLAHDPDSIRETDIADYALEALRKSQVKEIHLIGRRSLAQAAFTDMEIRELCHLPGADLVIDPQDVELDPLSLEDLEKADPAHKNNVRILTEQAKLGLGNKPKKIFLKFLRSPVEILGRDGKVAGLKLCKNKIYRDVDGTLKPRAQSEFEVINVERVFRSVGYMGEPLPGVPFNPKTGTIPNASGRVADFPAGKVLPGLYVVGWAKRGPSGVIGTNKPDALETVELLLQDRADLEKKTIPADGNLESLLKSKNVRSVSFSDWQYLDQLEQERGRQKGKVREKYSDIANMVAALNKRPALG